MKVKQSKKQLGFKVHTPIRRLDFDDAFKVSERTY